MKSLLLTTAAALALTATAALAQPPNKLDGYGCEITPVMSTDGQRVNYWNRVTPYNCDGNPSSRGDYDYGIHDAADDDADDGGDGEGPGDEGGDEGGDDEGGEA